jgi:hypothetical protein
VWLKNVFVAAAWTASSGSRWAMTTLASMTISAARHGDGRDSPARRHRREHQRSVWRLPDALVLACGELLDADAALTANRRWRRFERVSLIG